MNILKRFVGGVPDQSFKSWAKVFLGTWGICSSDVRRIAVTPVDTAFSISTASSDVEADILLLIPGVVASRWYLVSGTKRRTATKFTAARWLSQLLSFYSVMNLTSKNNSNPFMPTPSEALNDEAANQRAEGITTRNGIPGSRLATE